ncbi:MAG TPA: hypothetical protein VFQ16_07865 [Burkholderiaceae bacterium]|nr:hypothetical protein [Burkholderiaceae bacterium]
MSRTPVVTTLALAASLTACVVVPIDPRTGQPYPLPPPADGPRTTVVLPPMPTTPAGPSLITARLYPLNETATQGGMLNAMIVDAHTGRGTITVGYRGDTLQGEATRVDGSYAAFGRVHAEVLGGTPRASGGQRGIANAYGAKGVSAQCEYLMTAPSQGTGVCLFSDGAKYQIHFGAG